MKNDHEWINQWTDLFKDKVVLELGCGEGVDTRQLVNLAKFVVSTDIDYECINANQVDVIDATFMKLDHSKALPFEDKKFDVVVASLSLHYFTWNKTVEILNEISRVLIPKGVLLCRVNSTEDVNYGACSVPQLEPGLYAFEGEVKRFFSKEDIAQFFLEKWMVSDLQHCVIDRYSLPKRVWEFTAQKNIMK